MIDVKTLPPRERDIYRAGYIDGKDDALELLRGAFTFVNEHPDVDVNTPEGRGQILAAADRRLRAKGSHMTVIPAPASTVNA